MLSFQTLYPDTLELLKTLMHLPMLEKMRLVGGTALALQYGHRRSIDLDFFGHSPGTRVPGEGEKISYFVSSKPTRAPLVLFASLLTAWTAAVLLTLPSF